jgi:hypothetical protein
VLAVPGTGQYLGQRPVGGISERRLNSDYRVVGGAGLTVSMLPQTVGGTHDVPRNCT